MSIELLGVIVLSFTLTVVLFAYDRLLRELKRIKKDKATLEEKARIRAEELVRGARDKAVEIIGEAKVDAQRWQQVLDQELDKSLKEQVVNYKERLHSVSEQITEEVKEGAEDFKKVLEMETLGAQKAAAEKMSLEMARVDKEVEGYRKEKIDQIKANVADVYKEVARKALGRELDFNDHTEMIIEALEKAKSQNVI